MTTNHDNIRTKAEANLVPGFAVLAMTAAGIASGLYPGAPLFPFGTIAIAACLFAAVQMVRQRRVTPAYAAFFVATGAMMAALAMPAPQPADHSQRGIDQPAGSAHLRRAE